MKNNSAGKLRIVGLMATAGAFALATSGIGFTATAQTAKPTEWKAFGGDAAVTHYSPINQITAANVSQLKPVWIYDPGTFGRSWEDTPLMVGGLLYVSDAISSDVVALEPETGKEVWRRKPPQGQGLRMRSLAYWPGDTTMKPRIVTIWGGNVVGLDPKTGQSMPDWPSTGFNMMLPPITATVSGDNLAPGPAPGAGGGGGGSAGASGGGGARGANAGGGGGGGASNGIADRAAPVIYKNLIIVANASGFLPPPGRPADPRAYDLRTGKLVWQTRLVPEPADGGNKSWADPDNVLGNGSWGFLSLDEETGTVYVPTDSPSPDLVGIWRPGDNKWGDSTVALDALTGKIKWAFQNHHHDVYDYDTMSAPIPVEVTKGGRKVKLIVQTTKQGQMWILNAATGQPEYGYKELPIPQSEIPGEKTWPTQPFPDGLSLAQNTIDRDHLSQLSPQANADCKALWDELKLENRGPYTPPAADGRWTVMIPGAGGGIDWGGASIDPNLGYAITNTTNMPTMIQVTKGAENARGAVQGNNGYRFSSGYIRFSDKTGVSCAGGRQGELIAVNLATGKVAWRVPLGSLDEQYGPSASKYGATNVGPSIVTAGGVIFIAAARDDRFHAYDTKTGKLLWQAKMSATGDAAPMTYVGKDGRQYVVIAAGGPGTGNLKHKGSIDESRGEYWGYHQTLVAFALPRPGEKIPDIVTPYPKRLPNPGENFLDQ